MNRVNWVFYGCAITAGVLTFGTVIVAASAVARHRQRKAWKAVHSL